MAPQKVASLVGKTTRYIAGRNAIQTVYWRTSETDGRLIKTNKICQFDRSQKIPLKMQEAISSNENQMNH